jgi:hypothetical protein
MKTQICLRTLLFFLIYAALLSACKVPDKQAQATLQSVKEVAEEVIDAKLAAGVVMSNLPPIMDGQVYASQVGASLWAIDKAINGAPNAKIYIQQAQNIALFLSPGATDASGASYWFWGFIDVKTRSLIAVGDQIRLGANIVNCKTMSEFMKTVEDAGFKRVDPKTVPTLVAFLRLAIGYMKQGAQAVGNASQVVGGTISDILVVPGGMLMPGQIYPWCNDKPEMCEVIVH